MATVTFDTLKFVERLTAAGIPEAQAKAIAVASRDAFAESLDVALATKEDVFALRSQVQADLFALKNELAPMKADIALLKWMVGLVLGGIVALILKAFF